MGYSLCMMADFQNTFCAFGQVAKGTAKNLPLRSGATSVAIKMVKGKCLISSCFGSTTDDSLTTSDL